MDSLSQQIEKLLNEQSSGGMQAVDDYQTGLSAAAEQDRSSLDKLGMLYKDKSKFENPVLGALGLGLMKNTTTGNFSETMANGLGAAIDTQNANRAANLSREEKLAKLDALQAVASRQTATDTMDVYNKRGDLTNSLIGNRKSMSDLRLGNEPIVQNGDTSPQNVTASYKRIYDDYLQNPSKYSGPEGQALVAKATEMYRQEMMANRARSAATQGTPLSRAEAKNAVARLKGFNDSAEDGRAMLNYLALLRNARDETTSEGTPGLETLGTYGSWLPGWAGGDTAVASQGIKARTADVQLSFTQKTKGAISDSEMRIFGSAVAGPGMSDEAAAPVLDGQEAVAKRLIERSKFMQDWVSVNQTDYGADEAWDAYIAENPIIKDDGKGGFSVNKQNIGNWKTYVTNVNLEEPDNSVGGLSFDPSELPDEIKAWAEEQIKGGAKLEDVTGYLNENYGKK